MDESNGGMNFSMPVAPTSGGFYPYPIYQGGNGNNNGGFGGDWGWIILLLLLAGGGWGNGMGGGFLGGGLGIDFPWLMNGQQGINNNVSDGFRDAQLHDAVTSVRDGISNLSTQLCGCCGDISTQLCNGFNGVIGSVNSAQNALAQQMYTNQIADLERSFAAQTASTQGMTALQAQLAQCCCDNRAATQDVKYTIATEACATRSANAQNTQAILDKLCQLELDNYKRENDQLRSQLSDARFAASQTAQTAQILAGQTAEVDALYARLSSCPVGTVPVFGNQPIFTCSQQINPNNGCGCGCNGGF